MGRKKVVQEEKKEVRINTPFGSFCVTELNKNYTEIKQKIHHVNETHIIPNIKRVLNPQNIQKIKNEIQNEFEERYTHTIGNVKPFLDEVRGCIKEILDKYH